MALLKTIKLIILALFAIWFLVFAATNHDAVEIALFPLSYEIVLPKFLFAIACFLAGAMIASIALGLKHSSDKLQQRKLKQRVAALEEEIKANKAQEEATALPTKAEAS